MSLISRFNIVVFVFRIDTNSLIPFSLITLFLRSSDFKYVSYNKTLAISQATKSFNELYLRIMF